MNSLKTALATFWAPARSLTAAADGRLFVWPLILALLAGALFSAAAIPRVDLARTVADRLDQTEAGAKMTPHERSQAIETAQKVGAIGMAASTAVGPIFRTLLAAFVLWLAFKVAGGTPGFGSTFAVVAHAFLPLSLKQLLMLPALLSRTSLVGDDLPRLLPSNLAAIAADGTVLGPKLGLLASLDVFNLWALVLVAIGMAYVARVSRTRAAVTSFVLWASLVAVFGIAVPALTMGAAR